MITGWIFQCNVGIMEILDKDNMEGGLYKKPRRRSRDLQIVERKHEKAENI